MDSSRRFYTPTFTPTTQNLFAHLNIPTQTPLATAAASFSKSSTNSSASSSSIWPILALTPVILLVIWHLNCIIFPPPPPPQTLQNKRIILLIAHPDDESMFFSPTLQALTDPKFGNHLKILCLSSGNADGLGETRKKELEAAALTLGLRRREDVFILDDPSRFKDGMQEKWDEHEIARILAQAFAPDALVATTTTPAEQAKSERGGKTKKKSASVSSSTGPRATIDALITFDGKGISKHPNHIALYHGARQFLSNLMRGHKGYACPVTLYTLPSINIVRKYAFVLDVMPTYIAGIFDAMVKGAKAQQQAGSHTPKTKSAAGKSAARSERVVFVSDIGKYLKSRKAMVQGHKSQMVWFRWGWISLGRYMVVNDLRREHVAAS